MHPVKPKLVRITTVPVSLRLLLKGQMKYMKQRGFEVVMISSPAEDIDLLEEQEDCEVITLPMERKISLFSDLQALIRLKRILKNLQPDIVHTHTPKAGLLGGLAARWAGVPVRLHTIAGLPWMEAKGPIRWLLKLMEKLTLLNVHRAYPNSKGLLQFLHNEGVGKNNSKLKLLGHGSSNGIDCNYFSRDSVEKAFAEDLRKNTGLSADGWVWIFAGRLVREKGIQELLQAFTTILQDYPGDQLWLLGDEEQERDPLRLEDKTLIDTHPSIIRWGFQKDVRPYFSAADVLVFPSYREGLPNVPLQAGAMECALILSDINGCNEIVEEGVNGLLVPPKTVEPLMAAMRKIRCDSDMRDRFGQKSRERIQSLYSREQIWKLIEGEYRDMLVVG